MNKLTKLTIKKFRNVAPTTLEFRPGLNVLLGKNAAGKTTLLRLLSTAVGVQEEVLRNEVLEVSYRVLGESINFEQTITRTRVNEAPLSVDPSRNLLEGPSTIQQTDLFVFEMAGEVLLRAEVLPSEVIIERKGRQDSTKRIQSAPYYSVLFALQELGRRQKSPEITALIKALFGGRLAVRGVWTKAWRDWMRCLASEQKPLLARA